MSTTIKIISQEESKKIMKRMMNPKSSHYFSRFRIFCFCFCLIAGILFEVASEAGYRHCEMGKAAEIGHKAALQAGAAIPSFRLTDLNGEEVFSDEMFHSRTLLFFGSVRCPGCLAGIKALSRISSKEFEEPEGAEVIFVAVGDSAEQLRKSFPAENAAFKRYVDPEGAVADMFGVERAPHFFIVNGRRIIEYSSMDGNGRYSSLQESFGRFFHEAGISRAVQGAICREREPFLHHRSSLAVRPGEYFKEEIHIDFCDCPAEGRVYHLDMDGDGRYEISGEPEKDSFFIEGIAGDYGNHPTGILVEDAYGKTESLIDIYVTDRIMTPEEVRKEIYPFLYGSDRKGRPKSSGKSGKGDGIRDRRAVLFLGSAEERFWIDINLAYHVLQDKYGFTDAEIILLTPDTNVPGSLTQFDPSWIDGTSDLTTLENTFAGLASEIDDDDLLLFVFDGHGSGYYGPRTRRPYWNGKSPDAVYEGPIDEEQYDDPDYREDEFKTEFIESGQVNCVKYDYVPKGMETFVPCFTYYPFAISAGDSYYRFKLVSHFVDLPLIGGGTASDSDIYIEKIISYAQCDLNRNTIIEEDEVDLCDWDDDGDVLMSSSPWAFDEDDWFDAYSLEQGYHPYYAVNGKYYCLVDKALDDTLDMIGFDSDSDPLYLACLAQTADPEDLIPSATDTDNDGYSDNMDYNLDGDWSDYLSFDETLSFAGSITDDEMADLFAMINPEAVKIFFTESCFGGGFMRDLSNAYVVSMGAAEEDDTSSGNYFIRHFFMALNQGCEQFGSSTAYPGYDCESSLYDGIELGLDLDGDGLASVSECFRKAYEKKVNSDYPVFDDNADLIESYGDALTFLHELPYVITHGLLEGLFGDTVFLDAEFFGDINAVSCFDFDGPLNFDALSYIVHSGLYEYDYINSQGKIDFVCDGSSYTSFLFPLASPTAGTPAPTPQTPSPSATPTALNIPASSPAGSMLLMVFMSLTLFSIIRSAVDRK